MSQIFILRQKTFVDFNGVPQHLLLGVAFKVFLI